MLLNKVSVIARVTKARARVSGKGVRSKNSRQSPYQLSTNGPTLRPLRIWGSGWGQLRVLILETGKPRAIGNLTTVNIVDALMLIMFCAFLLLTVISSNIPFVIQRNVFVCEQSNSWRDSHSLQTYTTTAGCCFLCACTTLSFTERTTLSFTVNFPICANEDQVSRQIGRQSRYKNSTISYELLSWTFQNCCSTKNKYIALTKACLLNCLCFMVTFIVCA